MHGGCDSDTWRKYKRLFHENGQPFFAWSKDASSLGLAYHLLHVGNW